METEQVCHPMGLNRKPPPRKLGTKANPLPMANTTNNSPIAEISTSPPHSMAFLVALARVARGEIGFLIASLSQSSGKLTLRNTKRASIESSRGALLLVTVWSIFICTIVGWNHHAIDSGLTCPISTSYSNYDGLFSKPSHFPSLLCYRPVLRLITF